MSPTTITETALSDSSAWEYLRCDILDVSETTYKGIAVYTFSDPELPAQTETFFRQPPQIIILCQGTRGEGLTPCSFEQALLSGATLVDDHGTPIDPAKTQDKVLEVLQRLEAERKTDTTSECLKAARESFWTPVQEFFEQDCDLQDQCHVRWYDIDFPLEVRRYDVARSFQHLVNNDQMKLCQFSWNQYPGNEVRSRRVLFFGELLQERKTIREGDEVTQAVFLLPGGNRLLAMHNGSPFPTFYFQPLASYWPIPEIQ